MKRAFAIAGIVGLLVATASGAHAATHASSAPKVSVTSGYASATRGAVEVSQIGPAFMNGRENVSVKIDGMPTIYRDTRDVPYIAGMTDNGKGNLKPSPGVVTDGVSAVYSAVSLPHGRIQVQIWLDDQKVTSMQKFSRGKLSIQLPTTQRTQYIGTVVTSYGKPASLNVPLAGGQSDAKLVFIVQKPGQA